VGLCNVRKQSTVGYDTRESQCIWYTDPDEVRLVFLIVVLSSLRGLGGRARRPAGVAFFTQVLRTQRG